MKITKPWEQFKQSNDSIKKMWTAAEEVVRRATGKAAYVPSVKISKKIDFNCRYQNPDTLAETLHPMSSVAGLVLTEVRNAERGNYLREEWLSTTWLLSHCKSLGY